MRNTALATILTMLKAEVGFSLDATATGKDTALTQMLENKQSWLAAEYDWPFLRDSWDVACGVGGRYYALPTTDKMGATSQNINFSRPVLVETLFGSYWRPVDYGIGTEQYNSSDPSAGEKLDPIQRWQLVDDLSSTFAQKLEVWPSPATAQTLRITAQRAPRAISGGCDLDDLLLVYFVAADIVGVDEKQTKLALGRERLRRLLGAYEQKAQKVSFDHPTTDRVEKKLVPVAAAS